MGGDRDLPLVHEGQDELQDLLGQVGDEDDWMGVAGTSNHRLGEEEGTEVGRTGG